MESEKVIEQWNKVAENYSKTQRNSPNNLTNFEALKELLGDVSGKLVLDAGTGDGYFANELKNLGAKVFACDGSSAQIEIAKNNFSGIDFKICNLTKELPYESNFFDIVVSSLTIMDIDELDEFFSESNRILKSGGRFVFSIVHACFFLGHWDKDENGNKEFKNVRDYWRSSTEVLNFWGETTHYHRPITWYSKLIKKHGFLIEEIKENPDDKNIFEIIPEHHKRVPLYFCVSCVKK